MRVAALAAGLVLALVTPVTSTAAYIDSNGAVSAETQMNGGGCYPAALTGPPTEQLNLLNPEWAAIDVGAHLPPESDPVALHGTVVFAKINEGGDDRAITIATTRTRSSTSTRPTWGSSPPGTSGRTARRRVPSSGRWRSGSTRCSRGRAPAIGSPRSGAGSGTAGTRTPTRSARARRR